VCRTSVVAHVTHVIFRRYATMLMGLVCRKRPTQTRQKVQQGGGKVSSPKSYLSVSANEPLFYGPHFRKQEPHLRRKSHTDKAKVIRLKFYRMLHKSRCPYHAHHVPRMNTYFTGLICGKRPTQTRPKFYKVAGKSHHPCHAHCILQTRPVIISEFVQRNLNDKQSYVNSRHPVFQ